jgi:hypothetical protein
MTVRFSVFLLTLFWLVTPAWATWSEFNAVDSIITVPAVAGLHVTTVSVGCWARFETAGEANAARLWSKDNALDLRISGSTYVLLGLGWNGTDGNWSIPLPATNTPHHLLVTYDGNSTSNVPAMYLNGVAQSVSTNTPPTGSFVAGTGDLCLGNSCDTTRTWDGQVGECVYYNRVLTVTEGKSLAFRGSLAVSRGRVGYWPLGVFGARNYTSTGGLTGTPSNVTVSTVPGPPISYSPQGDPP